MRKPRGSAIARDAGRRAGLSGGGLGALLALALAAGAGAREVPLVILHTTDLHGRIVNLVPERPGDLPETGLLRLATLIRQERAAGANTLLVDCGDSFQGSPESLLTRGFVVRDAMAALRYDAWVVGNHEFDWGLPKLTALTRKFPCPILAANIAQRSDRPPSIEGLRPFLTREFDGVRVAVVGLTTPGIPSWSPPEYLDDLRFHPSAPTLERVMPDVRRDRPDVLILLVHQGIRMGPSERINEVTTLVRRFPEFDVILGGHTHEEIPAQMYGHTLFAQAGWHGRCLGRVDLTYDTVEGRVTRRQGRLIPVARDTPKDETIERLSAKALAEAAAQIERVVGHTDIALPAVEVRPGEPGVAALLRAAIAQGAKAEVVLHGPMSDTGLAAGPVRGRDIWRICPYENQIGLALLTAQEIREILEEDAAREPDRHVFGLTGLTCEYDRTAPAGRRVKVLRLPDGSLPHSKRRFRTAFNSYVAASGGERYPRLRQLIRRPESRFELTDLETRDLLDAFLRGGKVTTERLRDIETRSALGGRGGS